MELRIRKCARTIVVNDLNEVLMIKHRDKTPANPLRPDILEYWVPPGGGVEENETFEEAAIREFREETGLVISSVSSCIFQQSLKIDFGSGLMKTDERFFYSRIMGSPSPSIIGVPEMENIADAAWIPIESILNSSETFFPEGLYTLLMNVIET